MKKVGKKEYLVSFFVFLVIVVLVGFVFRNPQELFENGDESVNGEIVVGENIYDKDGNVYATAKIGGEEWMLENLRTVSSSGESWCYNNQDVYCERYGRLYNWEATMNGDEGEGSRGVCPEGWHVPTDSEWHKLESFFATGSCDSARLGWGCFPAGALMKEESWGGKVENMFTILPSGFIDRQGRSSLLGSYAYFWTSTKIGDSVWRRGFLDSQDNILRNTENSGFGYSVRCIKD